MRKPLSILWIVLMIAVWMIHSQTTLTPGAKISGATMNQLGGPPNYLLSCSSVVAISPPTPAPFSGLNGANTLVNDPEPISGGNNSGCFHNPIVRITDASTFSHQSMIVSASGSGDENEISFDSTYLFVQTAGLRPFFYSFNPSTMQAAHLVDGPTLHLPRGGNFSYTQDVFYSVANSAGTSFGTLLQQSVMSTIVSTPAPTALFDFSSSANCLQAQGSNAKWSDNPDVSKDDNTFSAAFSYTGGQGTGIYVTVWNRTKGCLMLNTQTGQVTSDAGWGVSGYVCGTPPCTTNTFNIHNVKLRKDGNAVIVAIQNCLSTCSNGSSPYSWSLTSPLSLTAIAPTGTHGGGHWTDGYTFFVNNSGNPQAGGWTIRTNPTPFTDFISVFPTGITGTFDQHAGWGNIDLAQVYPFFSTTNIGNAEPSYSYGWQDEVLGIYPAGIVKRFAHCYTRANPTFDAWNCIGSISQDGNFFMFTSPLNNQLGDTTGAFPCILTGAGGKCRSDVFIVKLK